MPTRRAFIFGRRTRRGTLMMLFCAAPNPIRGPFTLKAVVSAN